MTKLTLRLKFIVLIRLFLPPLIFVTLWPVVLTEFLVDLLDGEFFKKTGWPRPAYERVDKLLDLWWYFFVLAYVFIRNLPLGGVFLVLFLYRLLGQLLFFLTRREIIFVFFPNFFELYFFVYLLSLIWPVAASLLVWPEFLWTFLPITLVMVIFEYLLHIKSVSFHNFLFPKHASRWPKRQS